MKVEVRLAEKSGTKDIIILQPYFEFLANTPTYKIFDSVAKGLIMRDINFICLDFSNLISIDSSSIALIIELAHILRKNAGDIVVFGVKDKIKDMFKVIKLENFIKVFDSEKAAVKHINLY